MNASASSDDAGARGIAAGARPTILIVDDAPDYLMLLGELLAPHYEVRIAACGPAALELAAAAPQPALILLDVNMPAMDGFATLERLRAQPATRDIPVMFVTGMDEAADEQRGFDLGAVDYITKPPRPAILLARVNTQLELKRVRDDLKRQNASLAGEIEQRARAVKNLESFSYSVSHDLRAPLRVISGYANVLEESDSDRLSAAGRDMLERIMAGARKMDRLILDILEYSRVERVQRKDTLVDMAAAAAGVAQDLRAAYPHATFRLGELPHITADATMVQQILSNLISNAFKFSAQRTDASIEIGAAEVNGVPEFFVRDNGAGFDPRYASKLFGLFQRMHSEQEFAGTGVGLAVVKRLVEHHGGRISAESEPGVQTTFRFTLAPPAGAVPAA